MFDSIKIGDLELSNRIVMAAMTRHRVNIEGIPEDYVKAYYQQRCTAGLIITEGVCPSNNTIPSYARIASLVTPEQISAWRNIVDAIHKEGGKVFLQLMSAADKQSLESSASIPKTYTRFEYKSFPRVISPQDTSTVYEEYIQAARNALACGFDGIELHMESMRLLDANLAEGNRELESWSLRNRFITELARGITEIMGKNRVAIRIFPGAESYSIPRDKMQKHYKSLLTLFNDLELAYLHIAFAKQNDKDIFKPAKTWFKGKIIFNGGYDFQTGNDAIQTDEADLISFGSLFISNPDLVTRFRKNIKLTTPDKKTYFTAGTPGYIDYPPSPEHLEEVIEKHKQNRDKEIASAEQSGWWSGWIAGGSTGSVGVGYWIHWLASTAAQQALMAKSSIFLCGVLGPVGGGLLGGILGSYVGETVFGWYARAYSSASLDEENKQILETFRRSNERTDEKIEQLEHQLTVARQNNSSGRMQPSAARNQIAVNDRVITDDDLEIARPDKNSDKKLQSKMRFFPAANKNQEGQGDNANDDASRSMEGNPQDKEMNVRQNQSMKSI